MTIKPLNIVAVHGIRCHAYAGDVAAFAAKWRTPLAKHLQQPFDLQVAYWHNALGLPVPMGTETLPVLTAADEQLAAELLADLGGPIDGAQGPAGGVVNALLRTMIHRCGGDRGYDLPLVRHLLREVVRYFHSDHADKRLAVQQVVLDAIVEHSPDVVIAHSLGSVVTHETLWNAAQQQCRPTLQIPLLVTIGSPLAMPNAIMKQLSPSKYERPPNVVRWVNLREHGDYVAAAGKLNEHYSGLAADETIEAPGTFMPHDMRHYLNHPRLAALIELHLPPKQSR